MVLETRVFTRALDWYLDTLGMIVSDFLFLDGQRGRGPTMRSSTPREAVPPVPGSMARRPECELWSGVEVVSVSQPPTVRLRCG